MLSLFSPFSFPFERFMTFWTLRLYLNKPLFLLGHGDASLESALVTH